MKKKLLLGGVFFFFCIVQSFAQRTITGTVTTREGTPLVGASVVVVGQRSGETTGTNGTFSIRVPANANTLKITYVGYQPQDVSISGQSDISVTLES